MHTVYGSTRYQVPISSFHFLTPTVPGTVNVESAIETSPGL